MMNTFTLPLPNVAAAPSSSRLQIHRVSVQTVLPRVEYVPRPGAILQPGPLAGHPEVLSLDLTRGCVHRCPFCSARAHGSHPGNEVISLFADTADHLAEEIRSRRQRPRAVYVSPSSDPFPPLGEVQAATMRVVEALANENVETWLMTRGYIRPAAMKVLAAHQERVKVTIALTVLNRIMQRVLEPLAAPTRLRLRQIAQMRSAGIAVQIALEPLVPGLTDTRTNLMALLEILANLGIKQITAGYLFLRPGNREVLIRALEGQGWDEMVLDAFTEGRSLKVGNSAAACYLPKVRRQRGYAALMALAAGLGMNVRINGMTNPDFHPPRQPAAEPGHRQLSLPLF